jgi:hypothetical protein
MSRLLRSEEGGFFLLAVYTVRDQAVSERLIFGYVYVEGVVISMSKIAFHAKGLPLSRAHAADTFARFGQDTPGVLERVAEYLGAEF